MDLCEASVELKQQYLSRIPSAEMYDGIMLPGTVITSESIRAIKGHEFGKDDIVVASYPKSGTTWTVEIVSAIALEGNTDVLESIRLEDRVTWMELNRKAYAADDPLLRQIESVPRSKKIWFTSLPLRHLPTSIMNGKCKLVYVARNPKDQAVSNFHYHKMARHLGLQTELKWDGFFRLHCFLCRGSWFGHVKDYWKFTKGNPSAKFIFYENLKRGLRKEVQNIEQFLGVHLSEDQRSKVVEHCSFNSMKKNEMTNQHGATLLDYKLGEFLRKGQVGDWKNYFTVAQNEAFDELYCKKMEGSGLDFEF